MCGKSVCFRRGRRVYWKLLCVSGAVHEQTCRHLMCWRFQPSNAQPCSASVTSVLLVSPLTTADTWTCNLACHQGLQAVWTRLPGTEACCFKWLPACCAFHQSEDRKLTMLALTDVVFAGQAGSLI